MALRTGFGFLIAVIWLAGAPPKGLPKGAASDATVDLQATGYFDAAAIKEVLGVDPGPAIVVVEVELTPPRSKPFAIRLDDFLLRSDNDGQRSQPLAPSQIAGNSSMVVSSTGGGQGAMRGQNRGPIFGIPGIPGTGRGPVQTLPGQSPSGGSTTADSSEAAASVDDSNRKQNPTLAVLKSRVLAEGDAKEPVKGLLYFLMDGKHKTKHFELLLKTPEGRLSVRFKEPK